MTEIRKRPGPLARIIPLFLAMQVVSLIDAYVNVDGVIAFIVPLASQRNKRASHNNFHAYCENSAQTIAEMHFYTYARGCHSSTFALCARKKRQDDNCDEDSGEERGGYSPFGRRRIEVGPHAHNRKRIRVKDGKIRRAQKTESRSAARTTTTTTDLASIAVSASATATTTESTTAQRIEQRDPLLVKRDRALIALHSQLRMDFPEASQVLDDFPSLYRDCPSVASRLHYFRHELGLSSTKLRNLFRIHPRMMIRVLLNNPEINLVGTVEILQTQLNLTMDQIIQRKLYELDRMELRMRLAFFKSEMLGLSIQDIQKMVLTNSNLLGVRNGNSKSLLGISSIKDSAGMRKRIGVATVKSMDRVLSVLVKDYDARYNDHQLERLQAEGATETKISRSIRKGRLGLHLEKDELRALLLKKPVLLLEDPMALKWRLYYFLRGPIGQGLAIVRRRGVSSSDLTRNDTTSSVPKKAALASSELNGHNDRPQQDCSDHDKDDAKDVVDQLILERVRELLLRYPTLLCSDNVQRLVEYLVNDLGCSVRDLGRIIYRRPNLFQSKLEKLQEKIDYFRQQLFGQQVSEPKHHARLVKENKTLISIMAVAPDIFTQSLTTNLHAKFHYLQNDLGLNQTELRQVVVQRPQILSLSLDKNIKPKVDLVLETLGDGGGGGGGITMPVLREMIVQYPQWLRESMAGRIEPRCRYLQAKNLRYPDDFPLDVLHLTDAQWEKLIQQSRA